MSLIKTLYYRFIGDKIFIKIILFFSFVVFISLIIAGSIISTRISSILIEKELDYENLAIKRVEGYVTEMEDKVKKINLSFYDSINKTYSLVNNYLTSSPTDIDLETRHNVESYLNSVYLSDDDILDVILYKNSNSSVITSTKTLRNMSVLYDFSEQKWFKTIKINQRKTSVIPTYKPEYIMNSSEKVITYAFNLYDITTYDRLKDIGTLLINFKAANFKNALKEMDTFKGDIMVLSRDGRIVYSNDFTHSGEVLPYFYKLMASKSTLQLDQEYIINVDKVSLENFIVATIVPKKDVIKEAASIQRLIYLVLLIILIFSMLLTIIGTRWFSSRIRRIINSMKSVESGIFENAIQVKGNDEIDRIAKSFNNMCQKLNDYIQQVYVTGIKQKNAELTALEAQINPHFLFNTLESLRMKAVINEDNEVADMIYILSNLFRWNLKNKNTTISIEEELNYLSFYLELQKMRFGDRLDYTINISKDIFDLEIIKFILQPIVENAIQHGIDEKPIGGTIEIKGFTEGDNLVFEVCDNGTGISLEKLESLNKELEDDIAFHLDGIGLKNVSDRIKIIYGYSYGIKILSSSNGTIVRMILPIKKLEASNIV